MPVAIDRWVRAAVGRLPFDVAPAVAVGAFCLAVAPLLWLGAMRDVVPVTSSDMVQRLVPVSVTYVELQGMAMTVPFPAPGAMGRPPYGLLIRDSLESTDLTVVTTRDPPRPPSRTVIGRMVPRAFGLTAAERFSDRGEDIRGLEPARVLLEVAPGPDEPVIAAQSVAELAAVPGGSLVSVPLEFDGESIPTCALEGGCRRGVLVAGAGLFLHLAHGSEGGDAVLVQMGYPSSVVPGRWAGQQIHWTALLDLAELEVAEFAEGHRPIPNGQALEDFAARPGVQALAGWGRILEQESIVHQPDLVRDRLWLGPVLFATLGGLIVLGGRIGYPYFRPEVGGSRRWTTAATSPPASVSASTEPLPVVVSGHALKPAGGQWHLDEARGHIRSAGDQNDGRMTAAIHLADGRVIPLAAHDTGVLGHVERGSVVSLAGVRPALWAHWYGTDLRMTFQSADVRDRAADLVSRRAAPVRSGA